MAEKTFTADRAGWYRITPGEVEYLGPHTPPAEPEAPADRSFPVATWTKLESSTDPEA